MSSSGALMRHSTLTSKLAADAGCRWEGTRCRIVDSQTALGAQPKWISQKALTPSQLRVQHPKTTQRNSISPNLKTPQPAKRRQNNEPITLARPDSIWSKKTGLKRRQAHFRFCAESLHACGASFAKSSMKGQCDSALSQRLARNSGPTSD